MGPLPDLRPLCERKKRKRNNFFFGRIESYKSCGIVVVKFNILLQLCLHIYYLRLPIGSAQKVKDTSDTLHLLNKLYPSGKCAKSLQNENLSLYIQFKARMLTLVFSMFDIDFAILLSYTVTYCLMYPSLFEFFFVTAQALSFPHGTVKLISL